MEQLNQALESLKIKGRCVQNHNHRHLAFYDIQLDPGTMVSKLERRTKEIALALRSKTLPIVKLMPESGIVRLQVATKDVETVHLDDIFTNLPHNMSLPFIMGETDEGNVLMVDMAKNPHLLIAGGTGSGKSVALHNFIANIAHLMENNYNVELYLIDPKRVEFVKYDNSKTRGLIHHISYDYISAVTMLESIVETMNLRYEIMSSRGISDVSSHPGLFSNIFVIIDEVADLIMQDKKSKIFHNLIVKIAQKARAAGIHLILATQRPSTDVLTGLIKANFPGRLACKTASRMDSQVIMDSPGAETLLGKGDALFQNPVIDRTRFQIAYSDPQYILNRFFNELD